MGGGLPLRSVTLAVGPAASGKSSLCQHLVYGALEQGYGTAYFSSEQSAEGLIAQMSSIGLGVARHLRKNQLRIHSVPEPTEDEKPEVLLNQLSQSMERLSRGAQFIVVDSLTDLAGSCPEQAVIAFFSACRRLGNHGRTIFISIHSYAFGSEMFTRLRTLCDGYITLGSEQMMGKSVRTLEVNKIGTVEQNRDNMVSFIVEPEVGMRLLPLNKTKA
jgi:flagellar protein FlaH